MSTSGIRFGSWALAICMSLQSFVVYAGPADDAKQVIQTTMDEIFSVLKSGKKSSAERQGLIESIAYARFDLEQMAKLVLARNYSEVKKQEKLADFTQEFKKHLGLTYGRRLDAYSDEQVQVGESREESNKDVSVKTKIVGGNADGVIIEYRLRQLGGEWRVIDVIIEGLSLIANFRSQVDSIITDKKNGGIDKLIEKLRQKNGEKATQPVS